MNDPMWSHVELHFPHTEDSIYLKFTRFMFLMFDARSVVANLSPSHV